MKVTDQEAAPWHSIDGTDEEYRLLTVGKILRDEIRAGLKEHASRPTAWPEETPKKPPTLAVEQPEDSIDEDEYERQLEILQGRFARLVRKGRFDKRGLVLAFEGMVAAGKGGLTLLILIVQNQTSARVVLIVMTGMIQQLILALVRQKPVSTP